MYSRRAAMAMLLLLARVAVAQHQDPTNTNSINRHDSLGAILHKHGVFEGHFRTYSMSTINHGHNPDYFAQGIGGGLAYYSPVIKRFQIGLSLLSGESL